MLCRGDEGFVPSSFVIVIVADFILSDVDGIRVSVFVVAVVVVCGVELVGKPPNLESLWKHATYEIGEHPQAQTEQHAEPIALQHHRPRERAGDELCDGEGSAELEKDRRPIPDGNNVGDHGVGHSRGDHRGPADEGKYRADQDGLGREDARGIYYGSQSD